MSHHVTHAQQNGRHVANQWNGPQPAPMALWAYLHANFPQARNLGIFNRRNIAGTNTPSLHAEGRALDVGLLVARPQEKVIGDQLFRAFIDCAGPLGLQEIIWNRQIWSTTRGLHAYHGQNPHTDHIHVGFTRAGSQRSQLPPLLLMKIAVIRTGLDDLGRADAQTG